MPAATDKLLRRSTFFYRCRGVDVVGGTPYMVDSGPHGLHAAMVNFVAPAYGVVTMPSGRPGIVFNGATQYATLPLRFYDDAPTTEMTFVVQAYHRAPAVSDNLFNARNTAAARGVQYRMAVAERTLIAANDSGGVVVDIRESADAPYTSRTRITLFGVQFQGPTVRAWVDRVGRAAAVIAGAITSVAYDTGYTPSIGATSAPAQFFDGTLLTLGLFPWLFTDAEAKYMTDLLTAGAV